MRIIIFGRMFLQVIFEIIKRAGVLTYKDHLWQYAYGTRGVVIMTYSLVEQSGVCIGDYVEVRGGLSENSTGTVCEVLSQEYPPRVRLVNGDVGAVVKILNSEQKILQRIMTENQYTENKESFGEEVMRSKVIPQTVQSFLNSEGGYMYIGVKDTGETDERLAGLDYDFGLISSTNRSNDHLCDVLQRNIMDSLDKHLHSEAVLGQLVRIEIVEVRGRQIVEVRIQKSPAPWFYHHISKGGKSKQFDVCYGGKLLQKRTLDDFYIRQGNGKKMLDTHEKFYVYAKTRFWNQQPTVM